MVTVNIITVESIYALWPMSRDNRSIILKSEFAQAWGKMRKNCTNLGFIIVSDEDILDLEISMNDGRSLCMKIIHTMYHSLSNMELYGPLNLYSKQCATDDYDDDNDNINAMKIVLN